MKMDFSTVFAFTQDSPYFWAVTMGLVAILYYTSLPQATIYGSFPRAGGTILRWTPVHDVVADGYRQTIKPSKKPIVVRWWSKDYLIMPARYLADLRTASWSSLHFFRNISDALYLYVTVGDLYTSRFAERMVDVVKKGLNPQLPKITPILLEEIDYAFERVLATAKSTPKGKEVIAMQFFSSVVHRSATRIMIGDELCRDEAFLKETASLLDSIFFTAIVIVNLPLGPFRPVFARLLTLLHKWKLDRCAKLLQPTVEQRMERRRSAKKDVGDKTGDGIEWTLDCLKGDAEHDSPERLTHELLHSLWAASSAPGGMMTEIVYQLLTHPEYLVPLREEAENAMRQHGRTGKMLAQLHLQDSFIREVNRLLPTGAITCSRTVVGEPFTFSDGLQLPVGTRFGFPIKAMQVDEDNFDAPLEFDGFRFAQKASSETGEQWWSATAMSTTNLAWGYGNHICPGRFFAVRELKLILTKLLVEYDVSWDREPGAERPQCVNVEGQFVPNLGQKVYIRLR